MKAKDKKLLLQVLGYVSLLLAVVVFFMMFLNGAVLKNDDGEVVEALKGSLISFGGEHSIGKFNFNFLAVVGFLLPLVLALVVLVLNLLGKGKLAGFVSIGLIVAFILSTVGCFTILSTAKFSVTVLGITATKSLKEIGGSQLGVGAILGGVASILGILVTGAHVALPLVKK